MNARSAKASRIPAGTGFSPNLISLPGFLRAVVEHSGDREAQLDAIWQPDVRRLPKKDRPTRRSRSLPLEAAIQYGLVEEGSHEATPLARELAALAPPELYDRFASHLLLECGGLRVLDGIEQMRFDGADVTGDRLAAFLTAQGFRVGVHNTGINTLRLWLAKAGLFPEGRARAWEINATAKRRLVELGDEQIGIIAGFSEAQLAFVEGLCVLEPEGWIQATRIRDWAEARRGVSFGRGSLPKEVLRPLEQAGLIEFRSGGTAGGKSAELQTTEAFRRDVLEPFVTRTIRDLDPVLTAYYRTRPEDIFAGLDSRDRHVKGQALEAFAVYVMRHLGLRFVGWRKRAEAEVDALLEGVLGPVPTRWQVQCKNTGNSIGVEDVAKEVGLLPITGATHILFFARSRFTNDARDYARRVSRQTGVPLYLLDRDAFEALRDDPTRVLGILRDEAGRMLSAERPPFYAVSP